MEDPTKLFDQAGFDASTVSTLREAYELARKELHDKGQPLIVLEIMAGHIIALARSGERDPRLLAEAALAPLRSQKTRPSVSLRPGSDQQAPAASSRNRAYLD